MLRRLCFLVLAFPAAWPAVAEEPITDSNWRNHPAIVEIRGLYDDVQKRLAAGELIETVREFGNCNPLPIAHTRHVDARGVIRHYLVDAGSEDSAYRIHHYYDAEGRLRFVFIDAGAVNGTLIEYRIYLDAAGRRLWEDRRLLEGPGYTFPSPWPEDMLVRRPDRAFASEQRCGETPPQ